MHMYPGQRFRRVGRTAVAVVVLGGSTACGGDGMPTGTASPQVRIDGAPDSLFELDSVQLTFRVNGKVVPGSAVSWSVNGAKYASVSTTGLLTAIRATDFDVPYSFFGGGAGITAIVGDAEGYVGIRIIGWQMPIWPALEGTAYLEGSSTLVVDQERQPFTAQGILLLTCGSVKAGTWSLDLAPYKPRNIADPPGDPSHKPIVSSDTVLVAFDGEAPRAEQWQRNAGVRIGPRNGADFVRRMLRARRLSVTVKSYDDAVPASFTFRLGNVEQITRAVAYAACN